MGITLYDHYFNVIILTWIYLFVLLYGRTFIIWRHKWPQEEQRQTLDTCLIPGHDLQNDDRRRRLSIVCLVYGTAPASEQHLRVIPQHLPADLIAPWMAVSAKRTLAAAALSHSAGMAEGADSERCGWNPWWRGCLSPWHWQVFVIIYKLFEHLHSIFSSWMVIIFFSWENLIQILLSEI